MAEDKKSAQFQEHLDKDEKIEPKDWIPIIK